MGLCIRELIGVVHGLPKLCVQFGQLPRLTNLISFLVGDTCV